MMGPSGRNNSASIDRTGNFRIAINRGEQTLKPIDAKQNVL